MSQVGEKKRPRRGEQSFWLAPAQPGQPALPDVLSYRPAVFFECSIEFRNVRAELIHAKEAYYSAWLPEGSEDLAIDWSVPAVKHLAPEDLELEPRASVRRHEHRVNITKRRMDNIQADLIDYLVRRESLQIFYNPTLKWYSKLGEGREEFLNRVADELINQLQPKLKELVLRLKLQLEQLREIPLPDDVPGDTVEELETIRRRMISLLQNRMDETIMSNPAILTKPLLHLKESVVIPDEFKGMGEELARIERDIFTELKALRTESKNKAQDCQEYVIRLQPTDIKIIRRALLWVPV